MSLLLGSCLATVIVATHCDKHDPVARRPLPLVRPPLSQHPPTRLAHSSHHKTRKLDTDSGLRTKTLTKLNKIIVLTLIIIVGSVSSSFRNEREKADQSDEAAGKRWRSVERKHARAHVEEASARAADHRHRWTRRCGRCRLMAGRKHTAASRIAPSHTSTRPLSNCIRLGATVQGCSPRLIFIIR